MKFNSQICTTREQSERLLALGLKKETADCRICPLVTDPNQFLIMDIGIQPLDEDDGKILAWSLYKLIEMLPDEIDGYYSLCFDKNIIQYEDYGVDIIKSFGNSSCIYNNIVDCIEWLISEGYFNKEYLKQ